MLLNTPTGFAQHHPWDRSFFPLSVAVIWVVILLGFVPAIMRHVASGEPDYPLIIHIHAVAFVGFLVLLSVQVALIRRRRYDVHRRLGAFGGALALGMVVLGPWAAVVSEQVHFGTPQGDPPFLSVEFIEMVVFPLQVGAAIWLRGDPAAHKRLMLLAILFLTTAGFGRWLYDPLHAMLGDGGLPFLVEFFGGTIFLVLGLGAYDIVTRHRLHPGYAAGAALGVTSQFLAAWLYVSPAWKAMSVQIIGH
ncbi:MAG: hypothetical protein ACHRHE_25155 [Tepidisphaerales bacterium]